MYSAQRRVTAHLIRPALLIAPIVAALALFAIPAIQVSAHAGYDHSSPGDGEVVAAAPTKIDAYFKEEMSRANGLPTLIVVNSSGDTVSSNMALDDNDRKHISADLKADLPDGRYTVIWHNVSAEDSDEAQGAFQFYIGAAPTPVPSSSPGTSAAATTPAATATPAATTAPSNDSSSSDIPVWGLIVGIVAGVVVGGGAGVVFGRMGSR